MLAQKAFRCGFIVTVNFEQLRLGDYVWFVWVWKKSSSPKVYIKYVPYYDRI